MMLLLVVLLLCGCARDACDVRSPEAIALAAECKLRVTRECPTLTPEECDTPGEPCPPCPAIEACDKKVRELCGQQ